MTIRRAALCLYRAFARVLLPADFRGEYGAELEQAVAERLGAAGGARAWTALGKRHRHRIENIALR